MSKSRAGKDILIYGVGTILRQLAAFIMLPIYTSYLTPKDYGIVALLSVFIAVFELALGARFAQVVPRFYYENDCPIIRRSVLSTALTMTAAISCFGVFLMWNANEMLSSIFFGAGDYSTYVSIYSILLLTGGIEAYGLTYLRILEKPWLFVLVSLAKLCIQLSLNIYLVVYNDYGVLGVVISSVVSSSIFGLLFFTLIYYRCGFYFDNTVVKRLFIFSWPLWLAGGAAIYISSSSRYFIRIFSGLDDVGLFELATKFAMMLSVFVWMPFSNWWQVERFKILNTSTNISRDLQHIFDLLVSVMCISIVGVTFFAKPVIFIMSSYEFHASSVAVIPLTFSILFSHLIIFFNLSFLANDKTKNIAYLKYISALIMTVLYFILIPTFGFLGASVGLLISNFIGFLLTYTWGRKCFDLGVSLRFCGLIIISTMVFVFVDFSWLKYTGDSYFPLAAKLLLSMLFVILIIILLAKNKITENTVYGILNKFNWKLN